MLRPVLDTANIFTAVPMVFLAHHLAWRLPGQQQQCDDMLKIFVTELTRSACLAEERLLTGMWKFDIVVC